MPLSLVASKHDWTLGTLTPGVGIWDPSRKMATISSTNSSFLRRSGVRKALANAPSTCSSFGCRSGRVGRDQIRGSLTGQDDRSAPPFHHGDVGIILPCPDKDVSRPDGSELGRGAAGSRDLLLGRAGEPVRGDLDGHREVALAEHLDGL